MTGVQTCALPISWVKYERKSGLKFFFLFFSLSHPVLAKNNAAKRFFNFLNFVSIFFGIFFHGNEYERNSGLNFFFLFLGLSHHVLAKNNAGKRFFKFFCYFFGIFLPGSSMNGILV